MPVAGGLFFRNPENIMNSRLIEIELYASDAGFPGVKQSPRQRRISPVNACFGESFTAVFEPSIHLHIDLQNHYPIIFV